MTNITPIITLDGPGGSGKGTVGKVVAGELGWSFLDSGSLYRLLALKALKTGVPLEDEVQLAEVGLDLDIIFKVLPDEDDVVLDGEKVASEIRTEACGQAASKIAALPKVRDALFDKQRSFYQPPGLVADGRDMGSVVFREAGLKIYLTASVQKRAERRYKQLIGKGMSANLLSLEKGIAERDAFDTQRATAPLCAADDAIVLNTDEMSVKDVVDYVLASWNKRTNNI